MSVTDLRSALDLLRTIPGQLVETDVAVDPAAELSGVYRYVGAGGTVRRPTKVDGPAMVFHNIKGHPDASVAIGILSSRERVAIENIGGKGESPGSQRRTMKKIKKGLTFALKWHRIQTQK